MLITTVPFGAIDRRPLTLLGIEKIEYLINPFGRKLQEEELISLIGEFDAVIAGTEPITGKVLEHAPKLKLISRVGIGLDNVDLLAAKENNVTVSYTPDAPSAAVAELAICQMLSLLRHTHQSSNQLHAGEWYRHLGRRLSESVVGIIGVGRIGTLVIRHLLSFDCKRIMINDLNSSQEFTNDQNVEWCTKDEIYKNAPVYHNFRAGDVRHSQADISKATTNLSYVSEYHIKDGIVKSMSWYIKNVS